MKTITYESVPAMVAPFFLLLLLPRIAGCTRDPQPAASAGRAPSLTPSPAIPAAISKTVTRKDLAAFVQRACQLCKDRGESESPCRRQKERFILLRSAVHLRLRRQRHDHCSPGESGEDLCEPPLRERCGRQPLHQGTVYGCTVRK